MIKLSCVTGSAMAAEWLVSGYSNGFLKGFKMARKSILGSRSNVPAPINDIDIDDLLEEMDEESEEILEPQKLTLPEPKLDPIVTSSPNYESKWKNDLPNDFDIFRDLTGEWLEKNAKQPVYYVIYRDSRSNYVAERYPPYSWAKLQQEFGAGYYIVIAKERGTNRVVIQQPRLVEDFKSSEKNVDIRKEPEVSIQDISRIMDEKLASIRPKETQFQPQNQQPSITELLTLVFSLQEKAISRAPQNNDSALMGNIINLVQAQNEKSSQTAQDQSRMMIEMFSKMTENTNNVVKAINENQQKMFEKMNERIEGVVKELGKSNKLSSDMVYSPQQIIEMQQKAQQTGFEMWSKLETMADMKARQRIEIMESIKTEEIEEAKPKPFSERMFETMAPALATVLTQIGRQQAVGAPVPQVQQQQIRALPNANNVRQLQQRQQPQVSQQRPQAQPVQQARPQVKQQPPVKPKKEVVEEVNDGLPSVDFSSEPEVKAEKDYMNNPKFEQYISILQPILLEAWSAKNSIEQTGEKLVESLKTQGVSLPDFLENVPYEDVEDALSEFNLAPEIFAWLRELYAYIEVKIGLFPGNGTVG